MPKIYKDRGLTSAHVLDLTREEQPFETFKVGEHFFYDKTVHQKIEIGSQIYGLVVETGEVVPFDDKDRVTLVSSFFFGQEVWEPRRLDDGMTSKRSKRAKRAREEAV